MCVVCCTLVLVLVSVAGINILSSSDQHSVETIHVYLQSFWIYGRCMFCAGKRKRERHGQREREALNCV